MLPSPRRPAHVYHDAAYEHLPSPWPYLTGAKLVQVKKLSCFAQPHVRSIAQMAAGYSLGLRARAAPLHFLPWTFCNFLMTKDELPGSVLQTWLTPMATLSEGAGTLDTATQPALTR